MRDDSYYGCAETTLIVLQEAFGLSAPRDSAPAMALNGGIAYSGGMCGAISGAAMALGRLAEKRISDHKEAKRAARLLTQDLIREFEDRFAAHNCADLIDYDISKPEQHDAFIESGIWRDSCMQQIEFAVEQLHTLADADKWNGALSALPQE